MDPDDNLICQLTYDVCTKTNCSTPTTVYTVNSTGGNIYANIISKVGYHVANGLPVVKGQVYDNGLDFSPETNDTINSFDALVASQTKSDAFIILNLGNIESMSSRYTKWVISSSPSYTLMRPYWIGTFSASVLDGDVQQTNGFLLPGICPFLAEYTTEDLLKVQDLLSDRIATPNALITFISSEDKNLQPPFRPKSSSGVFVSVDSGDPFEPWFSLHRSPEGIVQLTNNDYKQNGTILVTIILSLVIAGYISYLLITVAAVSINLMYTKLVSFANHLNNYAELTKTNQERSQDSSKNEKQDTPIVLSRYTFTNIMRHAPSPSAFIDYFFLVMYRQFGSSALQFYHLLFKESNADGSLDEEFDPKTNMINGIEVKVLYEKFCFINHVSEEKLTDPDNVKVLKSYGYAIVNRDDLLSHVFTRIRIKENTVSLVDISKEDKGLNSLELYMKLNINISKFDEDQMEVDNFTGLYNSFCDFNRLPRESITSSMMKEKYGVDYKVVPMQVLMRIKEEDTNLTATTTTPFFKKLFRKFRVGRAPSKAYAIDISKLENHFNLIMEKSGGLTEEQLDQATADLIRYPRWWLWDLATVLAHQMLGVLLTVPIVAMVILSESQYQPWSIKDPLSLIKYQDVFQDPAMVIYNLFNSFSWNVALMIMTSVLIVFSFLDQLLYQAVVDFPQDKSFKKAERKSEEGFWHKKSRQLEWLLLFFSLMLYFGFLGLFLTWLLLGAFINPTSFLPFASAAATFVTFVVAKYKSFKTLSSQGSKAVLQYVEKIFGDFINQVLNKMVSNIEKSTTAFSEEKMKEVLESNTFKGVTSKLVESGMVDAETIKEYTTKIENLDTKTILNNAVAVMKDPEIIARELKVLKDELVNLFKNIVS